MKRHILKQIIIQQAKFTNQKSLVKRYKFKSIINLPSTIILSGVRRCGKSTLLQQIRAYNIESDYYLNFDDERLLHFTVDDFELLHELFIEIFGVQKTFYFDEIQNIKSWEFFVRRLHNENYKVYITGSNANLLSKELGTHLTGRHIQVELFPFSFKEYLDFNKITYTNDDFYLTESKAKLKSYFNNYYNDGGFPEYLGTKNTEYLKSLYNSILYRDILVRNKVINQTEIRELGYFLASNIGKPITYNSLKKVIHVKHAQTVKNYIRFYEETYLIFLLPRFNYSVKKQLANPKKIYFIDNALAKSISFRFSDDKGRFLENIVFLELRRKTDEIFYHREKHECDFLIREKTVITQAIQVSFSLENLETKEREINGLLEALDMYQLKEGLLLTQDEEDDLEINDKKILVLPIYKWLLKNEKQL